MTLVALLIAALATVGLRDLARAKEAARRTCCMGNVQSIGLAMFQYAEEHNARFMPLVDGAGNVVPAVDNQGHVTTLPSRTAFAVLLKEGYLTTIKVFMCPSARPVFPERVGAKWEDFKKEPLAGLVLPEESCSYGWDPTKIRHNDVDATCAIIADRPSEKVTAANNGTEENNSANHAGAGQNVLYNDGHCKWGTTSRPDDGDDPDIYTGAPGYERSATDAKIIR